ncbi:MAG: flagellar hook basal-body protein [Deltaproteobacteria bacterium]|nr:flagellar hook basal-body protein [Deltaproteobacteria bacterium]
MIEGLQSALSALKVTQTRVNQTAHNLANVSTPGFRPGRVEQGDVASGGVRVTGATMLEGGPIVTSFGPLDLAIDGAGFFVLDDGQGGRVYSRAGNFTQDAQGNVVDPQGRRLMPPLQVPQGTARVEVNADGQVSFLDQAGASLGQGQIQTAQFANPSGLEAVGGNAFQETAASGPPVVDAPGSAGHGSLVAGALQGSGTDMVREMVNLIVDSRTFKANIRSAQTSDEMLGSVLDLKR